MAAVYSVTAGAALAAATAKVAIALATGAAVQNRIVQIDITFNGTNAAAIPVRVDLVKPTAVGSGGSAYTPLKENTDARKAAGTTARVNDTTPGASPVIQKTYYVPPTSGIVLQFPLGREPSMDVSQFWEVKLTAPAIVDYVVNVSFEE